MSLSTRVFLTGKFLPAALPPVSYIGVISKRLEPEAGYLEVSNRRLFEHRESHGYTERTDRHYRP